MVPSLVHSASIMSNRRMGIPASPWALLCGCKTAAASPDILTMFKGRRRGRRRSFSRVCLLLHRKISPRSLQETCTYFSLARVRASVHLKTNHWQRGMIYINNSCPPGTGDGASLPWAHCHLLCAGTKWAFAQSGGREDSRLSVAGPGISF